MEAGPSSLPARLDVEPRGAAEGGERVLVCVGPSPGSARLVRAAHALASRLECPWYAVHVVVPLPLSDADRARVDAHLVLAERLGGHVVRLAGRRTPDTLASFARDHAVTRILVGRPQRQRWRDLLFGPVVEELVRGAIDVEVHATMLDDAHPDRAPRRRHPLLVDVAAAAALVGAVSAVGRVAGDVFSSADVVMAYLLAVLVVAFLRGRRAALLASLLSVAAFNYFFVSPFHTFAVSEPRNLLTFVVLLGVGYAASALADRLRSQEAYALAREKRTAALLSLTRAVATATDEASVARAIVYEAATRIAGGAALFVPHAASAGDEPELVRLAEMGVVSPEESEREVARLAQTAAVPVRRGDLHAVPVVARGERLAVLVLHQPVLGTADLADAYARQTALALARVQHAAVAEAATLRARTEELRSALLSTVSHDLRTPLAAITGAATALLDRQVVLGQEARAELTTSIRDEAARLERLVANLLEMTRLASGQLQLRREWVPLDEVVGAAFGRVEAALAAHPAAIGLPSDLPLVELDPVLFEHVLVNLLENAARYTPPGTPIRVSARRVPDGVELEVSDDGPGFPAGELVRLFDPFVRGASATGPGSGLGLAICRGIVQAHGGEIRAIRRPRGGASILVRLPSNREPPPMPLEAEEVA